MNRIMREYFPTFELYPAVRNELVSLLSDADLGFTPGGGNPPLGELCREALLVFYGKASVYLKAMGKERPEQMRDWIG